MGYVGAEVRHPERNILRALLLGTVTVVVLYVLVTLAFVHAVGLEGTRSKTVAADVVGLAIARGDVAISVLICVSALGVINGQIFTGSRIYYAMGRDHALYAPLGRQRRFSMGLIAPLAIYAGRGLWRVLIPRFAPRYDLLGVVLAFALFIPTTIMALVTPMIGALSFKESSLGYFLTRSEIEALDWLEANGGQRHALVLASPEVSLFVPMHGLRVVYGHPYETLNATARRQAVADFYTGARCEVIATEGVDYVLVGSRELKLAGDAAAMCPLPDDPVFTYSDGKVSVYAVFGD
jgi:hypothetical protein